MKTLHRALAIGVSLVGIVVAFSLTAKAISPSSTLMFPFYDDGQDGFGSDKIHIFCPACGTNSEFTASVSVNGQGKIVNITGTSDAIVEFPGVKGGPVLIQSSAQEPIVASQRTFYFSAFSEVYAVPTANADTELMLNWYDHETSGFVDHIHLANPNDFVVSVTVSFVSGGLHSTTVNLPANGATFVDFPGVRGGPVFITANAPILASSRTQHGESFNEVNAVPIGSNSGAATSLEMSFYDQTESFSQDNIHLGNPGASAVSVTLGFPGCTRMATIPARGETVVNCGSIRGGPVLINSTGPIIASQRVLFSGSFNEVYATPVPMDETSTLLALSWVDLSTSGFSNDNIHIYNASPEQQSIWVGIGIFTQGCIPGPTCEVLTINPGQEVINSFPGQMGGPVYIGSANGGVGQLMVSARTKYNSSFNEVTAAVIQ